MSDYGKIHDERLRLKIIELEDAGKSREYIISYIRGWNKKPTGTIKKEAEIKKVRKIPKVIL